ncbi:carbohydrate ABC transporter permease [Cohnella soli]|uniref:Carbohydrate ABC transporter permease n=1 Tax=Cohnella soli TaxID=425005 RepID=A0ABW0HWK7_9BACL
MVARKSLGRQIFEIFNYTLLIGFAIACILPLIHVLAISFSNKTNVAAGAVGLWPLDFTIHSYSFVFQREQFFKALLISVERLVLGTGLNMLFIVLTAYPLSKQSHEFRGRTAFAWIFVVTLLFNGGLIPMYMNVKMFGIMDSIWALVLPAAIPVFNCILLLNFFRGLPKALEEAAFVDGASHWHTLWSIYLPLSKPALATILLFNMVMHWNSWFDGMILMNSPDHYPLQSYLQTVVVRVSSTTFANMSADQLAILSEISDQTVKAAQIFMAALPIMLVYPFLQRYFMTGIVLGSVKE